MLERFQLQWNKGISDKDPQLILRDGLLEIYNHAKKKKAKALILLIDDVHNLSARNEQLTLLRNVLTDEQILKETNILTVVASIEEGWAPFLIRNNPIGRLFMPRRPLGPLTNNETRLLIDESLSGNMVFFDDDVKERVYQVTQGHVFEVQALCEALFDQQLGGRVSMANWETALHQTLLVLADAQFSGMKQQASELELTALKAIAVNKGNMSLNSIKKEHPEIKSPAEVLRRLTEKGLVNRKARGQYSIEDELFCEYLKRIEDE